MEEEYVEVTIKIKKTTLNGLKSFEDVYFATVEDMLSIEADDLLHQFELTAEM